MLRQHDVGEADGLVHPPRGAWRGVLAASTSSVVRVLRPRQSPSAGGVRYWPWGSASRMDVSRVLALRRKHRGSALGSASHQWGCTGRSSAIRSVLPLPEPLLRQKTRIQPWLLARDAAVLPAKRERLAGRGRHLASGLWHRP